MPQTYPISTLSKATGISAGRPAWKEAVSGALEAGIDTVLGAAGLSPGSKAGAVGELLAAAVPILGAPKALKALTIGKLAAKGKQAEAAAAVVPKPGIRAYHGSPHDFDQFSMGKIGTGEGAQAYGHGLYFADSEDVARSYRDQLSPRPIAVAAGAPKLTPEERGIADYFSSHGIDINDPAAMGTIGDAMLADRTPKPRTTETWAKWQRAYDTLKARATQGASQGKVYEVNINADPADFLDWDAPLSQQSEKARQALASKGISAGDGTDPRVRLPNGERVDPQTLRGESLYRAIGEAGGGGVGGSQFLRDAGIPGIKFLDGASRAAGQGSRNYVVFDDALIDILKKYGLAGMTTAALPLSRLARPQPEPE